MASQIWEEKPPVAITSRKRKGRVRDVHRKKPSPIGEENFLSHLAERLSPEERATVIAMAKQSQGYQDVSPFSTEGELEEGITPPAMTLASASNGAISGSASSLQPQDTEKDHDEKKATSTGEERDKGGKPANPRLGAGGFTLEQKRFLVEQFATFHKVTDVTSQFVQRFGFKPDYRHVEQYDGDSRRCRMGKTLRALFAEARKDYITGTSQQAIAHQRHRLRLLERMVERAQTAKEFNAVAKGLELAAREMGGYVQHVEHKGVVAHIHASVEEAKAELAMRLAAMLEAGTLPMLDVTPALPAPVSPPSTD